MTDIVQRADMWMLQGRDGPRLAFEALLQIWVRRNMGRQDLDRDRTVEPGIARALHFAHPAGAQSRQNLIRTEFGAGIEHDCCRVGQHAAGKPRGKGRTARSTHYRVSAAIRKQLVWFDSAQ